MVFSIEVDFNFWSERRRGFDKLVKLKLGFLGEATISAKEGVGDREEGGELLGEEDAELAVEGTGGK